MGCQGRKFQMDGKENVDYMRLGSQREGCLGFQWMPQEYQKILSFSGKLINHKSKPTVKGTPFELTNTQVLHFRSCFCHKLYRCTTKNLNKTISAMSGFDYCMNSLNLGLKISEWWLKSSYISLYGTIHMTLMKVWETFRILKKLEASVEEPHKWA